MICKAGWSCTVRESSLWGLFSEMPTKEQHLHQAQHNEAFLAVFDLARSPFLDWAVTAAFYAALHYLRALMSKLNYTNIAPDGFARLRHKPPIGVRFRHRQEPLPVTGLPPLTQRASAVSISRVTTGPGSVTGRRRAHTTRTRPRTAGQWSSRSAWAMRRVWGAV